MKKLSKKNRKRIMGVSMLGMSALLIAFNAPDIIVLASFGAWFIVSANFLAAA